MAGPCAWEQPLPQPGATGWNFSAQQAPGTQVAWIWLSWLSKIFILRLLELPTRLGSPIPFHHHPSPPKSIENSDLKFSQNNTISPLPSGQSEVTLQEQEGNLASTFYISPYRFGHTEQQRPKSIDSNRTRGVTQTQKPVLSACTFLEASRRNLKLLPMPWQEEFTLTGEKQRETEASNPVL